MKLKRTFYTREDVVQIARDLIGKVIISDINGIITSGIITETEAYEGITDRASHAYNNRRTSRTETMFREGGIAYIYLCYGMHHLFNFVTGSKGIPHAVLLRGIFPYSGIEHMESRKGRKFSINGFTDGPGKVTKAMGINIGMDGEDLLNGRIWVEDKGIHIPGKAIITSPRIGVDYAGPDARLPYRFLLQDFKT
ncbi:MAG: DNA-3-methyladenine glycosylase [Bacteroidales bacterium]|nr:DNA-3-methyladenine glycosylase [Bacteroidales bacterium]